MNKTVIPPSIIKSIPKITLPFIVFVFSHNTSAFSFSEDAENKLYSMDPLLDSPDVLQDQKKYKKLFFGSLGKALEKGRPLIELPYNPYLAYLLSTVMEYPGIRDDTRFLVLSFFHSDHDLYRRLGKNAGFALNMKLLTLKSMVDYPFIKKIEIPIDDVIDNKFIKELMKESY